MNVIAIADLSQFLNDLLGETGDEEQARLVIETVQGGMEAYLGRPVTIRQFTDQLRVTDADRLTFKNTPVVSVASIDIDGMALTAEQYILRKYGVDWPVAVFRPVGNLTGNPPIVTVSYTAGIDGPNEAGIRLVMLTASARLFRRLKDGILSVSSLSTDGGYSATIMTDLLSIDERGTIARYRRWRAG